MWDYADQGVRYVVMFLLLFIGFPLWGNNVICLINMKLKVEDTAVAANLLNFCNSLDVTPRICTRDP